MKDDKKPKDKDKEEQEAQDIPSGGGDQPPPPPPGGLCVMARYLVAWNTRRKP